MSIRSRLQQRAFADPREEAVVGVLLLAAEVNREVAERCQGEGITLDQYNVLRILRGAEPEGLPRCDIAARLISKAPDVTRMIDRLVRQGLVVRGWSTENRRLSIARITAEGLAVLTALDPAITAVSHSVAGRLPAGDLTQLVSSLDRLLP